MLPLLVAVIAVAILFLLVGAIVRFSIVSSSRTRGATDRLLHPHPASVEQVCGFPPPADLVQMYRDGRLTCLVEVSLTDKSQQPNKTWFFGGFYPLTGKDVLEQRKIHGIATGIPIADDMDKGVYFVSADGSVMFRPGGRESDDVVVAPSADALSRFEARDVHALGA